MTDLERTIKRKIFFFKGTRHDCSNEFDSFSKIQKEVHGKNSGIIKLKKATDIIEYDSELEKNILEDLDNCIFVKKIKTQSLSIPYKAKFGKKIKTYIPDIQLLLVDNSIVIVEVKSVIEMINDRVIRKSRALRKYCKTNGYGFAILGEKYYSFEELKKEKVSLDIQNAFIEYVKSKKEIKFSDCGDFKKQFNVNDKQICYIIWQNRKELKYQQFKIFYKQNKGKDENYAGE